MFWLLRILDDVVAFLFIHVTFNMVLVFGFVLVFLCYLCDIDPSSWIISIAFLVAFILLGGLHLSLGLKLTGISRRGIVGLSFVSIPMILLVLTGVLFFGRSVPLWAPGINFSYS